MFPLSFKFLKLTFRQAEMALHVTRMQVPEQSSNVHAFEPEEVK